MTFTCLPLHESLQRAIVAAGYEIPTPIQAAALPLALAGHDLLGTAQTGTGKTAAFVLPLLQRLLSAPSARRKTRALIVVPTRELAEQVLASIRVLSRQTNLRAASVYGGVGMTPQTKALADGTEIIVACPGRLLDHVGQGHTDFSQVECLVLDEADRMLDMGFLPAIQRILHLLPTERQTLLFSATFAPELQPIIAHAMRAPKRVDVGLAAPAETVAHALYPVPQHLKTALLLEVLRTLDSESVLIFTRTKHRANRVMQQLVQSGYSAGVLHANKSQNQRQMAMEQFRTGHLRILVATDIAARGLDIATISHVINFDMPDCADSYIHRIGRTGRAARTGDAFTFSTDADRAVLRDIERTLGTPIETRTLENFDYTKPPSLVTDARFEAMRPQHRSSAPSRASRPAQPAAKSTHGAAHRAAPRSAPGQAVKPASPASRPPAKPVHRHPASLAPTTPRHVNGNRAASPSAPRNGNTRPSR